MKTLFYNPSTIELEFAKAVFDIKDELQQKLNGNKIIHVEKIHDEDNPHLIFKLMDEDGDKHELMVQFIQRIED